jgi:hypothetical protein
LSCHVKDRWWLVVVFEAGVVIVGWQRLPIKKTCTSSLRISGLAGISFQFFDSKGVTGKVFIKQLVTDENLTQNSLEQLLERLQWADTRLATPIKLHYRGLRSLGM